MKKVFVLALVLSLLIGSSAPAGFSMLQVVNAPAGFLKNTDLSEFLLDASSGKLLAQ